MHRKPGDWVCACGELNFASRSACRRCQTQKSFSASSSVTPKPGPVKPGDWKCSCSEINFASRTVCRFCFKPKPSDVQSSVAASSTAASPPTAIVHKPGDWDCPSCNDHNFAVRAVCRRCGNQRPPLQTDQASGDCVVCFGKADTVIVVCGHLGLCQGCANLLHECPVCRAPYTAEQIVKVYRP
ncbi:RNA-binding protein cabeza [Pelomyxa schiedti]|nr:RNA-binding protein cabeza [Pelomyxa schiedti]